MNKRKIDLFKPYIPNQVDSIVLSTLHSKWIAQGPNVNLFEQKFKSKFCDKTFPISTNSTTSALHLAYILADIKPGDEVISTIFTCVATNLPLLWMGVKIVFADIDKDTLSIDTNSIEQLITNKTKAIVYINYGGFFAHINKLKLIASKYNLKLIADNAHCLGSIHTSGIGIADIEEFNVFSFQAIKHLTTGDGGMLTVKDINCYEKGKLLRWFGIDREHKFDGKWDEDITVIGYKYQMNDIAAAIGIGSINTIDDVFDYKNELYNRYKNNLYNIKFIENCDGSIVNPWLVTIDVDNYKKLKDKLLAHGIESSQIHYRNDKYSIFGNRVDYCPNMDYIENRYLCLPLHMHMTIEDVNYICDVVKDGY